jgi:hypothetical protein
MIMAIPSAKKAMTLSESASVAEKLFLVAWGVFVCQIVFDGVEHVSIYPHYYNSTWIVFAIFAWYAFNAIPKWFGKTSVAPRLILPTYAASLMFCTAVAWYEIHRNGGSRGDYYGAVVSNQMDVTRQIMQFSDESARDIEVPYWQVRPDAPTALFRLLPQRQGDRPTRRVVVEYRNAFRDDARLIVRSYPLTEAATTQP